MGVTSTDTQSQARSISTRDPARLRAQKVRRRKLITWLVLIIVAVVGGAAYARYRAAGQRNNNQGLSTATVETRDIAELVTATGSVTAQTGAEVKIGSQITGVIKRLHADVGSKVQAGQIIAELDLPDVEAQFRASQANLDAAKTKLQQQESQLSQVRSTSSGNVGQAVANLHASQARLASATAAAKQQPTQTSTDIQRAQAALSTAKSSQQQVISSAKLQVSTAEAQLRQANANAKNAHVTYLRQQNLYNQGYIAAQDVDNALAQDQVTAATVDSSTQNVDLVKAKVASDLQAASDQVAQAVANLNAAKAETFQNTMKDQDVQNAQAAVRQMRAALVVANANTTNDTLKQQDIDAAKAAVAQATDQVAVAQAQEAKTVIRTPISGTVLQLAQQQGETIAAGLSAPTVIIVADLNRLQVDAFVDETDIGKVRIGQPADVTVDAYPDQKFPGHVSKIASGSTIQQTVVTYDVTIALDHPANGQLKPDMTANVSIHVGDHPDVLAVPNEAVKPGMGGGNSVVVMQRPKPGESQPRFMPVPVEVGASDGFYTEIKSGLHEGQTVVLAGAPEQGPGGHLQMTPFGVRPSRGRGRR